MAYARESHERLRQFVICGSTNDSRYLKDDTGNRRYLPIAIISFDLEQLKELRDQLWAEASAYEQAGESIRLNPSLYEAAAVEQKEREIEDTYEIQLAPVLGSLVGKIRIQEVWKITGGDLPKTPSNAEQARITSAMKKLGWERDRRRLANGDRGHVYVRGTKAEQGVQLHVVGGPMGWSVNTTAQASGVVVARPAN
jgi:predicted P-loop ATPase